MKLPAPDRTDWLLIGVGVILLVGIAVLLGG